MAKKGQTFQKYPVELKREAVRLHIEEKWTYRKITAHFQIQDADRVRKWVRKYREQGEFGLLDQRGRKEEYQDTDRQIERLKRENTLLKKCLAIWKEEKLKPSMRLFDK